MNPKKIFEQVTGYWLHHRSTLPRGTDLLTDLKRICAPEKFATVMDVGGNVGQSVEVFLRIFSRAKILSFEPVLENYKRISETYHSNPRVSVQHLGFSDTIRTASINVNPDKSECSLEYRYGASRVEEISLTTVDTYCEVQGISSIDFMKVDVEGHELCVLEGATHMLQDQAIRFIFLEAEVIPSERHFIAVEQYANTLKPFGYSLMGIYNQMHEWNGHQRLQFVNALFASESILGAGIRSC
jgi:FkbM family methyltransferase